MESYVKSISPESFEQEIEGLGTLRIRTKLTLEDVSIFSGNIFQLLFSFDDENGNFEYQPEWYDVYLFYFILRQLSNVNIPMSEKETDFPKLYDWMKALSLREYTELADVFSELDVVAEKQINHLQKHYSNMYSITTMGMTITNLITASMGQNALVDMVQDQIREKMKNDSVGSGHGNIVDFPTQNDESNDEKEDDEK